jgi:hypothetical protein
VQGANDPFVHVFLFQCDHCGAPVATASASGARNLEQMDARSFALACNRCGWSGRSIGTAAKRHWVDIWDSDGNGSAGSGSSPNHKDQSAGTGNSV